MSQIVKGFVYTAVLGGVGWALLKVFTPTEDKMREKLGRVKDKTASECKQRTSDIMAALKKEAGIEDSDTKKKR
ncbi:hypothetical protein BaRGS_00023770 [Batillaria attramentaria]|uniref:YtxH domain-containing protein n=1 Tax=Batillaria attramentaria TaxID=370345 RepID=A0ABD0KD76_9CAEN